MKITFLPHAVEQMRVRGISEERARATLESPDREYASYRGRQVAEADRPGGRIAVKVVYIRDWKESGWSSPSCTADLAGRLGRRADEA